MDDVSPRTHLQDVLQLLQDLPLSLAQLVRPQTTVTLGTQAVDRLAVLVGNLRHVVRGIPPRPDIARQEAVVQTELLQQLVPGREEFSSRVYDLE